MIILTNIYVINIPDYRYMSTGKGMLEDTSQAK